MFSLLRQLYVQVLIAIVLGISLGIFYPEIATSPWVKALGDGFIKLIKMMIPPIIFCSVVSGISHVQDARKVGQIGIKALLYFEVISTFALIVGLLVGNILRPGHGFSASINAASVAGYAEKAAQLKPVDFLLGIIPDSFFGALAQGDILHVLVVAVLFGFSLMALRERGQGMRVFIDDIAHVMFGILAIIMKAAPVGAFGAMAFTVGKYGPQSLVNLAGLVASFYLTAILFVVGILGGVARFTGFNILRFLGYIKDELLLVLGTSSSETALPRLMNKLEALGCSKAVVGLVVPTGYSFNLDGTNIYMTLTILFIAQALNIDLTLGQQFTILAVAMLTSKGASGVSGAGFITLAATLSAIDPAMVPGMAIVFGVDKFMSECRALTNIIGNGVATVVIASWEGELDREDMRRELNPVVPANRED
jgi:aerobic C4-dicarboxylate transport protein